MSGTVYTTNPPIPNIKAFIVKLAVTMVMYPVVFISKSNTHPIVPNRRMLNTFDSSSSHHPETLESQIARPQGVANSEPSATAQTLRKENHPDPDSL